MSDINNPIKPVENRDERGRFGPNNIANPNGRPKKGLTLTDIAKQILEETLPSGVTRKQALMSKVAQLAYEGNETMIKLLWNYVDGLPTQRLEHTGAEGNEIKIIIKDYGTDPDTSTEAENSI